jgi:hypothetical protein
MYGTLLGIVLLVAPEPRKLVKGTWIKMPEQDYWLHYMEWVSLTHGIL